MESNIYKSFHNFISTIKPYFTMRSTRSLQCGVGGLASHFRVLAGALTILPIQLPDKGLGKQRDPATGLGDQDGVSDS